MAEQELGDIVLLMKQLVKGQEILNAKLEDIVNIFKKYEVEEVMNSEYLRED